MIRIVSQMPLNVRALMLDRIVGVRVRSWVLTISFFVLCASLVVAGATFLQDRIGAVAASPFLIFAWPLALVFAASFLIFFFLEFYYRSNLSPQLIATGEDGTRYFLSIEVARVFSHIFSYQNPASPINEGELLHAFLKTPLSTLLAIRLGMPEEALMPARQDLSQSQINAEDFWTKTNMYAKERGESVIRVADILLFLYDTCEPFKNVLFKEHVERRDLVGVALWVEGMCDQESARLVWWNSEYLSRVAGLGKDLGFGFTYTLNQYSHDVIFRSNRFARESRKDEIRLLEETLARSYEANVLLIGEEGVGKHTVIEGLAEWILKGKVVSALEFKRIVMLDTASITASAKTKGAFEELVIRMFNESVRAGNIILVIEDLAGWMKSVEVLGVDLLGLLGSYLEGSNIQVIALSDPGQFHRELEPNGKVMKLFQPVTLESPSRERVINMLEDTTETIESVSGKFFTYQSLVRAVELAERFIAEGTMPEKAIDLLDETASSVESQKVLISPQDIESIVEKRTHIPTSVARGEEKGKLLHMEDLLKERLVGQEKAITVVSEALRRSRAGLKSSTRPIGSFLFLGPTGVGKTETARALAEVYFGSRDAMIRFDMSEYQGPDGVAKLIGSFDSQEPGLLASRLRQSPFSLLLFDEFEKASHDVHNLFLQILDEGMFSDGSGRKVSARECMIIATSNAGTSDILSLVEKGIAYEILQRTVIDAIRTERIFAPELLNRFDAVVVYQPLAHNDLVRVAMLLLKEVSVSLKEQEVTFEPSQELAVRIAQIGFDPVFGARPMRRAIQDRVEDLIAKKILSGNIKRGDTVRFTQSEIDNL